jgi:NADH-quinone oxidoreductase subunit H
VAFAAGVVILVMGASTLFERNKEKVRSTELPAGEAPNFPVPELPHVQSINVSGGK